MLTKVLAVALAVVATVASSVTATSHIVKEQLQRAPHGWTASSRAAPEQPLSLIVMVKQQNLDLLEATLNAVSDPRSAQYGQHLTNEEVHEMVAPREEHIAQVMQWLSSHGVRTNAETLTFTPNRDMIKVRTTVAKAEQLLKTKYFEFDHSSKEHQLVRALSYSLPSHLHGIIDSVGPTTRFPSAATIAGVRKSKPVKKSKKARVGAVDCSSTTPDCLKSLYSVNDFTASPNTKSVLATTGYLEQYIAPSDLASFFAQYDATHTRNATIVGPNDPTQPGVEASLDIQYTMGVGNGIPTTFWYTPGRMPGSTENEPFLDFMMALASTSPAPQVISTSYGDDEHTVDIDYATRVNVEFQKAGVRGISILFSSGDGGVSGGQAQACSIFVPTYPAGSPFVTAVGGTTSFNPEVAVDFSTGGFSNYWDRPDYQTSAVDAYKTNYGKATLPSSSLFNQTGRGFPDVSAQGTNYPVFTGGFPSPVDGTSCSTPTFSAIIALLNDIRLTAGKSTLGFLNPLLYQNPGMFTDITAGNNPGCGTNGFTAVQGWDPVTGLGTPNFEKMAAVIKALP